MSVPQLMLLALVLFEIKHFLADFVLQTYNQVRNKGTYLHPQGLLHAGIHTVGSIPALMVLMLAPVALAPASMALLLTGEFLIHYHTDWTKSNVDSSLRLNDTNALYWTIFGSDQLVHQMTYLGMVYAAVFLF